MGDRVKQYQLAIGNILHHCKVCGRVLTTERSIERGIGPECERKKVTRMDRVIKKYVEDTYQRNR